MQLHMQRMRRRPRGGAHRQSTGERCDTGWRVWRRARAWAELGRPVLPPGTLGALVAVLLAGAGGACGNDKALDPPPPVPDEELYWALNLNHHAVLMSSANSLYDTLTLVATPRNYRGEPLGGLGQPTFTSPSPEQLRVSPEGKLTALAPTSEPLRVVATLWVGDLKHADTTYVMIVANPDPPVLTEFSLSPPDSGKVGMVLNLPCCSRTLLSIRATDAGGNLLTDLPVHLRSSDPSVVMIENPAIGAATPINSGMSFSRPGTVLLYASTTVFGVAKADTVPLQVGWPVARRVILVGSAGNPQFARFLDPAVSVVGKGALVWFIASAPEDSLDFTFADADLSNIGSADTYVAWDYLGAAAGISGPVIKSILCGLSDCTTTGNITAVTGAFRVFPVAGTYEYRSARYGVTGRIVVLDESSDK